MTLSRCRRTLGLAAKILNIDVIPVCAELVGIVKVYESGDIGDEGGVTTWGILTLFVRPSVSLKPNAHIFAEAVISGHPVNKPAPVYFKGQRYFELSPGATRDLFRCRIHIPNGC